MLESRKIVLRETAVVAIGVLLCCAVMAGVFCLIDAFDLSVLWGCIAGYLLTVGNFFMMAVGTSLAADKAQEQNVSGGKKVIHTSMTLRYLILIVLLVAMAKSGVCNVIALVLPLTFVRPVLMIGEFFRKKG